MIGIGNYVSDGIAVPPRASRGLGIGVTPGAAHRCALLFPFNEWKRKACMAAAAGGGEIPPEEGGPPTVPSPEGGLLSKIPIWGWALGALGAYWIFFRKEEGVVGPAKEA